MEQVEQAVELYDFLYRDAGRIDSYYTQLFEGRLSSRERTDSVRDATATSSRANIDPVTGETVVSQAIGRGVREVVDPHDLIVTDVLRKLQLQGRIVTDLASAAHGALVMAEGTIVFIDKSMVQIAAAAFEVLGKAEESKPRHQRNMETIQALSVFRTFLGGVAIPSSFLLRTNAGAQVAGTLKDMGMEEPISTYYFKHGNAGLANVRLLGIKEIPTFTLTLPQTELIGAGQQAAQGLSAMLFPKEAHRVTPIAIFRTL